MTETIRNRVIENIRISRRARLARTLALRLGKPYYERVAQLIARGGTYLW